jgi:hypothetical protein
MREYPTEEQLKAIEEWDYTDLEGLFRFIQSIWWMGEDMAEISDVKKDEYGREYRMVKLVTGGWSGNEDILRALHKNYMVGMISWQSSFRGGLHIYHIRKIEK